MHFMKFQLRELEQQWQSFQLALICFKETFNTKQSYKVWFLWNIGANYVNNINQESKPVLVMLSVYKQSDETSLVIAADWESQISDVFMSQTGYSGNSG